MESETGSRSPHLPLSPQPHPLSVSQWARPFQLQTYIVPPCCPCNDALRDLWTAVGTDAPHNGRLRQCRGRCVARVCTARKMDGSHRTRGKPGGTGARQAVPLTPSSTNTTSKHTRPTPARLSVLLSTTDVREPAPPPHCRRSSPPVCACTKIGRSLWKGSARRDNQSYLGG